MSNLTCLRLKMLHTTHAQNNFYILHFTYAAISAVTFTINIVALVVFYKISDFKTLHRRFLVILSCSDLLASIAVEPFISYDFLLLSDSINDCRISNLTRFLGFNIFFISVTIIALINIEQFLMISRPFASSNMLCSFSLIMFTMATIWTVCIIVSGVSIYMYPFSFFPKYKTGLTVTTLLIYSCMCLMQMKVNRETRRLVTNQNRPKSQQIEDVKLRVRVAKMATSIILVFGLCYVPSILVHVYEIVRPSQLKFSSTYIRTWCFFISYLNPLLDPLVYCFRLKSFRNYLFKASPRVQASSMLTASPRVATSAIITASPRVSAVSSHNDVIEMC